MYLKLVRYPNLLIMAATQCLAAGYLAYDFKWWQSAPFIFTLAATLLIGAGGYIINDVFDIEADLLNKPQKTFITPANRNLFAQVYYGLSALGILLGMLANVFVGIVCAVMVALLYMYSYKLKKTVLLGNAAVAVMSAAALGILQLVVPAIEGTLLWLYAAFAFITTLVREAVKDIEDAEGDRAAGYQTLPVVKGIEAAHKTAALFAAVQILLTVAFAVGCLLMLRLWAFYYLVVMVVIPSVGLGLLIFWATEKKHYSQASLYSKLIMLAGIVSMILTG